MGEVHAADVMDRPEMHLSVLNHQIEMLAAQPHPKLAQCGMAERPTALVGTPGEVRQQLFQTRGESLGLFQSVMVVEPEVGSKNIEGEIGIKSIRIEGTGHV